jgi:UDP-N-acetylglucosamine 1-carboxyvinyltransferase
MANYITIHRELPFPDQFQGRVRVSGAKNAALPILTAAMMVQGPVVLNRVPHLKDVTTMIELMGSFGVDFLMDESFNLEINAEQANFASASTKLVQKMRASFLLLGPMLARFGRAELSLPGGCDFGDRPVDIHLSALKQLGVEFSMNNGQVIGVLKHDRLIGAPVQMAGISVTATENVIMAACLAEGTTQIYGAAIEPEIVDLVDFLNTMGAKIGQVSADCIEVEGVERLHGGRYTVMGDRIEAGTFLIASVMNQGHVTVEGIDPQWLTAVLAKLTDAGAQIHCDDDTIEIQMHKQPKAVSIETAPYPGIPTDLQAQWIALSAVSEGQSVVRETVFANRFSHIAELKRMGAQLRQDGDAVYCQGVPHLLGANVVATDLRASASLVLAGCMAKGTTTISKIHYIDRGYEYIENKLMHLGVNIKRC